MPRSVREQTDHSLVGSLRRAQGRAAVAAAQLVPGEDAWLTLARNNPNANIVTAPYDPLHAQAAISGITFPLSFMWLASSYLSRSTPIAKLVAPSDGALAWGVTGWNGAVLYLFDPANSQLVLLDQSGGADSSKIKNNLTIPFSGGGTHGRGLYFYGIVVATTAGITAGNFYGSNARNVIPDSMLNSSLSGAGLVPVRFPLYVPGGTIAAPPAVLPFSTLQSSGALGIGAPWFGIYSA